MPTYDYQCRSCGVITEVVHSMLEDGPSACERCGGQLRRVVHPTGIIFKGSGFYKNDSRSSTTGSVGDGSRAGAPDSAGGSPAPTTTAETSSSDKVTGKPASGNDAAKGTGGSD